jgi:predicted NAD-dependent protein-ADP-ribosyltransferase YbiA (DUF1768 family)
MFYDQKSPYYFFTNLSPHPVAYNGEMYPTAEHLFQAFKVSLIISQLDLNLHLAVSGISSEYRQNDQTFPKTQ